MANKKTRPVTRGEFDSIISTIQKGFVAPSGERIRPNAKIAAALVIEGNLGLRIGDIVKLRLSDIICENGKFSLDIIEQKTKKSRRRFTIPSEVYIYLQNYALQMGMSQHDRLFPICARTIEHHLQNACEYLGLIGVGTHSFRKFFAVSIYKANGNDAVLIQTLLNHSSLQVTQHYLSVEPEQVEKALKNHVVLPM